MVRKVRVFVAILLLLCATGTVAQAATYDVYEGSPSNTYIQYYKDILSGLPLNEHYIVFRSGQNSYVMVTGDIVQNNGLFTSDKECKVYTIENTANYSGYYSYKIDTIDSLYVNAGDKIVYSDVGVYPQLEERGAKYEILTTILLVAMCVAFVCRSIFCYRPR